MKGSKAMWLVIALVGLCLAAYVLWTTVYSPQTYRFELTIRIETPEGVREGSSVYQVEAANSPALLPEERKRDRFVRGQAVAVDLPNGQTVFSLLRTDNPRISDLALMSMEALDPAFENDVVESAARIVKRVGVRSQAELAPADYPVLVRFRDIRAPESIERLNPANISSTFGPGYRVQSISVELTEESVSAGLERRLPWIDNLQQYRRDSSNIFTSNLPKEIGTLRSK